MKVSELFESQDESIARLRKDYKNALAWVNAPKNEVPDHERAKWERRAQKLHDHAKKQFKIDLREGAMTTMPVRGEKPMALPLETKKVKNPAIGTLAFERLPKWKQAELRKASDERTQKQINREKAKISEDKKYFVNFESWKMAVKAANPGKTLQFKGRIEGGKHLIYAEVKGEDRCYAVWDDDKDEGELLGEGLGDWLKAVAAKVGKWLMEPHPTEKDIAEIKRYVEAQLEVREAEERESYKQIAAHLSDAQIRRGVKLDRTPTKLRRAMEAEFKSRFA